MGTTTRSILRTGAVAGIGIGALLFAINLIAAAREHRAWVYWSGRGVRQALIFLGGGLAAGLVLAAVTAGIIACRRYIRSRRGR